MADADLNQEEQDDAAEDAQPGKKSPILKVVLMVLGIVLAVGAGAGGAYFFMSGNGNHEQSAADAESNDNGENQENTGGEMADADAARQPAIYFALDPAFVVNFQAGDSIRFLQTQVEVMSRDKQVITAVEQHMPVIRNNLIILFSSQDFATISTRVGKERLRAQTLSEVQKVLKREIGEPGVEAVYFTSFVMQ
jgi:flagellar FliL protein